MDRLPRGLEVFRATHREECGLIVKTASGSRVVQVENVAVNDNDYAILMQDVEEIQKCLEPGETITGFFHTHLPHHSCEPSDRDFDGAALFPEFTNLIYKPDTGEYVWYGCADEVER